MRKLIINITSERVIKDIQDEFSKVFPFLKIEFQKKSNAFMNTPRRMYALPGEFIIGHSVNPNQNSAIAITPSMTVRELEESCEKNFEVYVQFYRKSGSLWLKVTMTDNWTMKQQNELGSEISTLFDTDKQY